MIDLPYAVYAVGSFGFLVCARATPLLFASLGGLISESAGVVNFALEGMMLAGAFGAVWVAHASGSPWWGLVGGALTGMLLGVVHAVVCLNLRANQIVSSIALNLLAAGATGSLLNEVFRVYGTSPTVPRLPSVGALLTGLFPDTTAVGSGVLGDLPITVPLVLLCHMGIWSGLHRTALGLVVRACGEDPDAARAVGVGVLRLRFGAVVLSGVLAGLGGATLSIAMLAQFVERMTQGRGYLAIVAIILGRWDPKGVLLATLFLGGAEAFAERLAISWPGLPHQALFVVPYALGFLVLALQVGGRKGPSGLGRV